MAEERVHRHYPRLRFIASKIVNKQGEGILLDVALGIIGAMRGALLAALDIARRWPASGV
jgi:uncharacterized membrane protein YeaQ/YmgE (transglycosylase-associated protein family)